jgi:thiol-disulfide isomerase/thioredoxin
MLVIPGLCLAGVLFGAQGGGSKAIDVQIVNYDGLKGAVRKNRGKVVVVYFWADWSPPAIRWLPHFAKLQKQYGTKGLETITVEIGREKDEPLEQQRERVRDRLKRTKTNVTNLMINENYDFLAEKLHTACPFLCAYVFNREGRWFRYDAAHELVDPAMIEKLVVKLLQEK